MFNIVIFDDDAKSAARLHSDIQQALPPYTRYQIREITTRDALAHLATTQRIDILFADVVMPEGQPSGIEVCQELFPARSRTQIVFVSGYLEQATEIYAQPHLYFLLKPIDQEKLTDALNKAIAALETRTPHMLRIKVGHKNRLVNSQSIIYIESNLHKVTIHTRDATYETYAKLNDLTNELSTGFTRCHRSFLVNLAYIKSLETDSIVLRDGTLIPVSRRHLRQTQHDMLAYLAQRNQ